MATIGVYSGSQFALSPYVVYVTGGNYANATFHRVRLGVTVNSSAYFEFSSPVTAESLTVRFDISSAIRAFVDQHEYQATVLNQYPVMTVSLTACDDYMVNGEEHTGAGESSIPAIGGLYAGALTDIERISGTRPERYSRKPASSPEICFTGMQHLHPGPTVDGITPQAPAVSAVVVTAGYASATNTYGIPVPSDGYEIRFINSLGVHENIFVKGFPGINAKIDTDKFVCARQETLTDFSRGMAVKQNNREQWKMTSGPVDVQWASWFVHEFLLVRWAWMNIGGRYIPCNIIPDDNISLRNRTKASPMEIPFTVELDITGSPYI